MSKEFKYPKKGKEMIKIPCWDADSGMWIGGVLHANGDTVLNGRALHKTKNSCWIPCIAHNIRVGYTEKQVKKIIKKTGVWKKSKN